MKLPMFIVALAAAIWLVLASPAQAQEEPPSQARPQTKPNILLILTDNTGWGDWGVYGGGALRGAPSPNIDRLAAEGMRLLNANTEPQCTPSRSALLTGRHAIRSGTHSIPLGTALYGLLPWEVTLAETLSDAGYATAAFGKWHLGRTPGRWPTDQGFDEWYGIPNTTDESIWTTPDILTRLSVPGDVNVADSDLSWIMEGHKGSEPQRQTLYNLTERRLIDAELTRRAIDFMTRSKEVNKPFFAYVPLTATHYPTLPHPDFAGKSGHGDYADMLVQTDHYVGQLLHTIQQLGIRENTIVIFTADNGVEDPVVGDGQYNGWSGPWAGTYFTAMEGGLRVPFIIRWPNKIPAGAVNNEIVHSVDLFPTLAAIAGANVPDDRAVDGVNMADFFLGNRSQSGREGFVIFVADDLRAVKWRNWKLHYAWQETKNSPIVRFSTMLKVVDLTRDPRETRQVAEPYNTWLYYPTTKLVRDYQSSLKKYPNVPLGAPNSYVPSRNRLFSR
ncbi:MAG: arylsulfatase [Lyngbya sp. HA4199-MV5]|jgi:arylsulfatase|nr:arylsulfatase [Lyngbya sp. HA4199-MV5]